MKRKYSRPNRQTERRPITNFQTTWHHLHRCFLPPSFLSPPLFYFIPHHTSPAPQYFFLSLPRNKHIQKLSCSLFFEVDICTFVSVFIQRNRHLFLGFNRYVLTRILVFFILLPVWLIFPTRFSDFIGPAIFCLCCSVSVVWNSNKNPFQFNLILRISFCFRGKVLILQRKKDFFFFLFSSFLLLILDWSIIDQETKLEGFYCGDFWCGVGNPETAQSRQRIPFFSLYICVFMVSYSCLCFVFVFVFDPLYIGK